MRRLACATRRLSSRFWIISASTKARSAPRRDVRKTIAAPAPWCCAAASAIALMVDLLGSQCDFCTPEFAMSLFALFHAPERGAARREEVNDWIARSPCRCTGCRPIVDAGIAACAGTAQDRFTEDGPETARALARFDRE